MGFFFLQGLIFVCVLNSGPLPSRRRESRRRANATVEHEQPIFARQFGGVRGKDRVENAGTAVCLLLRQFRFGSQRFGLKTGSATYRKY